MVGYKHFITYRHAILYCEILCIELCSVFKLTFLSKETFFQVHIKIIDENDNPPIFTQHHYSASIVETIPLSPPAPIVQVRAQDKDYTSELKYTILSGNVGGELTHYSLYINNNFLIV